MIFRTAQGQNRPLEAASVSGLLVQEERKRISFRRLRTQRRATMHFADIATQHRRMRGREEDGLAADVVRNGAEFVVQRVLLIARQAAAMLAGHVVGFLADAAQAVAQAVSAVRIDVALRLANVDTVEFFRKTALYLIKARARVHRCRDGDGLTHHHRARWLRWRHDTTGHGGR